MIRKSLPIVLLLLLGLAVTACGSSSNSSSSAPQTSSAAGSATTSAAATSSTTPAASAAQPSVAKQVQATPGSGKGVTIGYLSNDESVPIVHVISEGIESQAKRAGVDLVFCNGAGSDSTALACARTFKSENVQGIINFQHDLGRRPEHLRGGSKGSPCSRSTFHSRRAKRRSWASTTAVRWRDRRREARPVLQVAFQLQVRRLDLTGRAGDRPAEHRTHGWLPDRLRQVLRRGAQRQDDRL